MRKQYQAGRFGIGSYKRASKTRSGRRGPGKVGLRLTAAILALIVLLLLFFAIKVKKDNVKAAPDIPVKASITMDLSCVTGV